MNTFKLSLVVGALLSWAWVAPAQNANTNAEPPAPEPAAPTTLPALPARTPRAPLTPAEINERLNRRPAAPSISAPQGASTNAPGSLPTIRPNAGGPRGPGGGPPPGSVPGAVPPPGGPPPGAPPVAGQPGPPGATEPPTELYKANVPADEDSQIPSDEIKFYNMPIESFLDIYSQFTRRTIIRPATLPQLTISLKAQSALTRKELIQAFDSVLSLNGYTVVPMGEKFANFVPNNQAVQEGAAFTSLKASQLPEAGQFVTHIVQLKHVTPAEVQPVIVPFAKNPAGIVPIESSMVLVLRDNAANVKRMLEVIEKIDVVAEQEYKLEVVPIRYGKVEDIYNTMNSLTGGGGGGGGVTSGAPRAAGVRSGSRSRMGSSMGSTMGGMGNRMGGMNTGLNTGLRQNVAGTVPGQTGGQSSFQGRLQQIINRAAGGDSQILGDARIVPDERSNSLLVYANKEDMKMITNIVAKVDTLLAQVLIEAIIMEVGLTKDLNYGVSASQNAKKLGGGAVGGGVANNESDSLGAGRNFLGNVISTNALTAIPKSGGLGYFARFGNSWDVALTALASDSTVNVLSRPRIQTTHAVPATFEIGSTVPYITGTYYSDYGGTGGRSSYQQLPVVTSLNVTPFITPDGLVVMEIDQHIEELGADVVIDNNKVPTTTTRSATSTVSVKDGEMILLGGFISEKKNKSNSGIPLLKDIPGLGVLFRSNSSSGKRTELIILMRPTVLDTAEKATSTAKALPGYKSKELKEQLAEQESIGKNITGEPSKGSTDKPATPAGKKGSR